MRTFHILATTALAATAVGANRCPVECTAFDKFGAKATDAKVVHHMTVTHSTIHAIGAHGPATKHADCKSSVGGCTDAKSVPHKCSYNEDAQTCQCTCLRVAEATAAATQAPKKAGEMVVEHKVRASMKLENLPLESFTESAQLGVRVAIAKAASVHRDDVTLANVRSLGGRRLAEAISAAAAGGVAFDVVIAVFEAAKVSEIKAEVLAVVEDAPTAAAFAKNVVAEMVAIVSLDALVDQKIVAALSAAAVAVAPPSSTETKIKAGCYIKAHSCPNHKWATGKWSFHGHGSTMGKAFCLAQAVGHHNACGGDVMDPWSQKWVDHEGEVIETYPKPGCYWKLTTCPNHPNWLTTPANGGSASNWKKHRINDQKNCVASAWSHHVNCGLPDTEASATMFIGDENSADPKDATTHAVSCGIASEVKLPVAAVSMSSTLSGYTAAQCIDGDTTSRDGMCHSGRREKAWIKVDLGHNYKTSSVVITNRKDCCQNRLDDHVIETSTDDKTWTQCFRGVLPHTSGSFTEGCKSEARYVRARMINPEYLNLQEIEVRGTPLCGVSHAPHKSIAAPTGQATFTLGKPGKLAVASAQIAGDKPGWSYGADLCHDGNADNFCHSGTRTAPWLTYDMGKTVVASQVKIFNRKSCCQNRLGHHALQVSDDNKTWKTCGTYTADSSMEFTENCNAVGRYVRVQMLHNQWLNLGEVDVIGSPFPAGIKELKAVSASMANEHHRYPASKCINGNLEDYCHSTRKADSITLDMGKDVDVDRVVITNRSSSNHAVSERFGEHVLEVSKDGKTFTQCGKYQAGGQRLFVESCQARGRFVRVRQLTNDYLNLAQVQVFGN